MINLVLLRLRTIPLTYEKLVKFSRNLLFFHFQNSLKYARRAILYLLHFFLTFSTVRAQKGDETWNHAKI